MNSLFSINRKIGLGPYLIDITSSTIFGYFIASSAVVLLVNGYGSRISLLGFLLPHASKELIWSVFALFSLRPKFGWRFPFAMLMTYCAAELLTNWIWVFVHWWFNWTIFFLLSNVFFILGVILGYTVLRGHYSLRFDWSILPFAVFILGWVSMGYWTEANVYPPTVGLEIFEFIWSVLFLIMASQVFRPVKKT